MKSNQGNSWVNLQDSEWNVTNLLDGMGCDYFTGTYRIFSTRWFQGIIYFFYSAIFVVALAGNGLVCYVVYSSPRMKTVTNVFIVNLAFGDILIALFCVPPSFISILILQYWPFGQEFCPTVSYLQEEPLQPFCADKAVPFLLLPSTNLSNNWKYSLLI
ncbi:RYamide receptor-like [Megachile rotundata]|uniref:RYamide receptor-like n=1 Tax=Megachile rotundata TaxID=143995 RepID=UPI003FD2CDE6